MIKCYFRTVKDIELKLIVLSRILLKTLQNARSAFETILINNLSIRIKTLTVLTILLIVLNIISSLFGMNVPLSLQDNQYASGSVIMIVVGVVGLTVWCFKKHEWL